MSFSSWKHYITRHPNNKDINDNAGLLQQKFSTCTTPEATLNELIRLKHLICLSRIPLTEELQATFHHDAVSTSIAQTTPYFFALTGFGDQARAVRISVTQQFSQSRAVKVPPYVDLMSCSSRDEILQAQISDPSRKLYSYAILPPCLAECVIDSDDWDVTTIFMKITDRIKSIRVHGMSEPAIEVDLSSTISDEYSDVLYNDPVDQVQNLDGATAEATIPTPNADLENEAKLFHPILVFLWSILKKSDTIPGSPIILCNKQHTLTWQDEQHNHCIKRPFPPSQGPGLPHTTDATLRRLTEANVTMTQNVLELSNAVTAGKLTLPKQQDDDDAVDGAKRYKRFPLVHRNIIKLLTLTEDMGDTDIPNLKPTDIMLEILGCGPPASIQGQLEFLLESNGNLGHPEAAACTALRHGFMTSTPNPNSPNGALCLWLYPHESYGEAMSAEKRMKFAEQAGTGQKYDNIDLTLLTESKIVLPHSFDAFLHMLKNIWHITELFGGRDSFVALSWKKTVDHAKNNEALYRRLTREHPNFYTSLACDYHRRFMTYLKSCGHASWAKIAFHQLHFERIFQQIEDESYTVRIPTWAAKTIQKDNIKKRHIPSPSPPTGTPAEHRSPTKRARPNIRKKGPYVKNPDQDLASLIPSGVTYQQLFHRDIRRLIPSIKHTDGTIRCNNYHHRGNCHELCDYAASHAKSLTDTEKAEAKQYVTDLLAKYNASTNAQDPIVPNGNPPGKG